MREESELCPGVSSVFSPPALTNQFVSHLRIQIIKMRINEGTRLKDKKVCKSQEEGFTNGG